jgi:hypothetical protein
MAARKKSATAKKKEKSGSIFVALNEWDDTFVKGTRDEIEDAIHYWMQENKSLDETNISVFVLGRELKTEAEVERRLRIFYTEEL